MAPHADLIEILARLRAGFPDSRMPDETVLLYAEKLADLPPELLSAVVEQVIENSKFLPRIAEIRREAARISGLLPPPAAAILELVRRADVRKSVFRRDGSFAYEERYWEWPDDADPRHIDLAQQILAQVGDPVDDRSGKDHFAWDTGFAKTYEARVEAFVGQLDFASAKLLPPAERRQITAGA